MERKTVLITGAAGGLGRVMTGHFSGQGWNVVAADIRMPSGTAESDSPQLLRLVMDVTSDKSVSEACERVRQKWGTIDLIINNAGIDSYFPLSEAPAGVTQQVFGINFFGAVRVNQVFLPLLKKPGGRIIHISSESLRLVVPFMPYPLTKNLLERYAKVIRQELRFAAIDVTIVRPGAIATPLLETVKNLQKEIRGKDERAEGWKLGNEFNSFARSAAREIPSAVRPEKVAAFVYRVAAIKNPRAVYRINNSLKLRMAALMPFFITEKIIRRMIRVE
jgi:NAD(P)-dependent dehydrogenase (short-subunit alcohol dehydrogenase family)